MTTTPNFAPKRPASEDSGPLTLRVADRNERLLELLVTVCQSTHARARPGAIGGAFLVPVQDVFSIPERGTVVTGRVEHSVIKVGEEIEIVGIKPTLKTTCSGVEMFRQLLDQGQAGDNVGILLRDQVLFEPARPQRHAYFPTGAIASLVHVMSNGAALTKANLIALFASAR